MNDVLTAEVKINVRLFNEEEEELRVKRAKCFEQLLIVERLGKIEQIKQELLCDEFDIVLLLRRFLIESTKFALFPLFVVEWSNLITMKEISTHKCILINEGFLFFDLVFRLVRQLVRFLFFFVQEIPSTFFSRQNKFEQQF